MKDIDVQVRILDHSIRNVFNDNLSKYNLTFAQLIVIHSLSTNDGFMKQKEIEKHTRLSHPTVVGLIERLKDNGYVEYYMDENDKRNKIVKLTDKSLELLERLKEDRERFVETIFGFMSEEEKSHFQELLEEATRRVELLKGEHFD